VKFLGKLAPQQVRAYYPLADYTLLYSGYEGLSHVILESLAAGTPVSASDKGGNPEVITHGQNGLLVPYADTAALTTALGEAFAEDRPQKLRAGATFDPGRFSWPRLLEQTFQLLEQVGGGLK
jgi:glycosyltransferase involved in cell wall biosynthesis